MEQKANKRLTILQVIFLSLPSLFLVIIFLFVQQVRTKVKYCDPKNGRMQHSSQNRRKFYPVTDLRLQLY